MGKHKTKIERIVNAKNRHLAFYKRKKGLLKKAMELSIMCDVHIFMCIFNTNAKKCAEFTTLPLQKLIDMYNNIPRKDVSVFAPNIELDKSDRTQKITPVEWNSNTKDKLIKSAEIIKKTKLDSFNKGDRKRNTKEDSKQDENSKSEMDHSEDVSGASKSKSKASKSKKAGVKKNNKRKKVSDSDSDNSDSDMDEDEVSVMESEPVSKGLEDGPNESVSHLNNPSGFSKIVFSSSPATNLNTEANLKSERKDSYNPDVQMASPKFKTRKSSNAVAVEQAEQKQAAGYPKDYDFKGMISPMVKEDQCTDKHLIEKGRKESPIPLENYNQPSKNDDNQSFTFDHNNPATSSMKSPGSAIQYSGMKREISNSSPFPGKFTNMASPNLIFGYPTTKNGNQDFLSKSPIGIMDSVNNPPKLGMQKESSLMKMLDGIGEIGDIDESFAATKAAIQGKATDLEQGDTDK